MSQHDRSMRPIPTFQGMNRALALFAISGLAVASATANNGPTSVRKNAGSSDTPQNQIGDRANQPPINSSTVQSSRVIVYSSNFNALQNLIEELGATYPTLRFVRVIDSDLGVYELDAGDVNTAIAVRSALMESSAVNHVNLDVMSISEIMLNDMFAQHGGRPTRPGAVNRGVSSIGKRPQQTGSGPLGGLSADPFLSAGLQWIFDNQFPTDVSYQFNHNNIAQTLYTMQGLSGQGVNIAISNVGDNTHIDTDHTELDMNFDLAGTDEFDPNLLPDSFTLTAWSGIFGAQLNGVGMQGISPNARFGLFNWPAGPDSITLYEYEGYNWRIGDVDVRVYDTGGRTFYSSPWDIYNRSAVNEYVSVPLRNSYAFGRGQRGIINIFGAGTQFFAPPLTGPVPPDPYNFPPSGSTWSPIDQIAQQQNSVGLTITDGWITQPHYFVAQLTNYPPANDRRNMIINTVAEDGYADIYSAIGSSMFASFYGGTTNLVQEGGTATAPQSVLTTTPGPGGALIAFPPLDTAVYADENMSGPMIAAGVVSLMLEANPNLTNRDIQHIFFQSIQESTSRSAAAKWPQFTTDRSYYTNYIGDPTLAPPRSFWQVNSALYSGGGVQNQAIRHSDIYGFGVVDADLAIQKATDWPGTDRLISLDTGHVGLFATDDDDDGGGGGDEFSIEIADASWFLAQEPDGELGVDGVSVLQPATTPMPVICVRQNIQIESVVLELTVEGTLSNALLIEMESPTGTRSILKMPYSGNPVGTFYPIDENPQDDDIEVGIVAGGAVNLNGTNYALFRHEFLSWKHWGEMSGGEWRFGITNFGPDEAPELGVEPTDEPTPGADMILQFGELGLPFSTFKDDLTIVGYRFRIFGTDTGAPIFDGCNPLQTSCPADLDGNGIVDFTDLQIFVHYYTTLNAFADVDGDGNITYADLILFRSIWVPGFCNGDGPGGRPHSGTNGGGDNDPVVRPI